MNPESNPRKGPTRAFHIPRARVGVAAGLVAVTALTLALLSPAPGAAFAATATAPQITAKRQSFADLVERVQPAVVNVSTRIHASNTSSGGVPFNFPEGSPFSDQFREFFQRRFGTNPQVMPPEAMGVGSGFFIDAQGHVVTNNHVIKEADEITVTLQDGTELPATVLGHDDKTDLAVLQVKGDGNYPYVSFGDSDHARVGDWVVAVGSPFGLGGTVTAGIISARGRDIRSGPFDDFLQVDAPINKGNSGGPLFDQDGKVIGVNTAIFSPSGGNVGIGFAIPSQLAQQVVSALLANGHVDRGWMGVSIQSMTPELADSFGLDKPHGALVAAVVDGSPAEQAGIKVGDIITGFDGKTVDSMHELPRLVAATKAGDSVPVEVLRSGESKTLSLKVAAMPGDDTIAADEGSASPTHLGVQLSTLDDDTRSKLGLDRKTEGVLIANVEGGSPAAREGLRPGDVILRVGNEAVKRPQQVVEAVRSARESKHASVVMLVSRNGNERFVAVPFNQG